MVTKTWITCNACGADAFSELSTVDEWHIGRCSKCSLIYVNPIPYFQPDTDFSEMSLDFQYTQYMYQISPTILEFEAAQLLSQFQTVSALNGNNGSQEGKFLDVGCGSGASVKAAVDLGWEAIGIDIDPELIRLGKEQLGVDLRCGHLLESNLEGGQFEFIRLRDVIEHLPNPREVLVEIKRLLAPTGVLLIVTPNEMSLPNRLRLLVGKRKLVASVQPPHHLHGFMPSSLDLILRRAGLDVRQIETTTPIDPVYVTSNNMRSARNKAFSVVWHFAKAISMGSVLIGWARKGAESDEQSDSAKR